MTFKELYDSYKRLVYNLALQYTQQSEDAEEITQDVFMVVYEKLNTFRHEAEIKTWIYRITINKSLDHLKAKKRKKRWSFLSALSLDAPDTKKDVPDFNHPGVELEQKEALARIFACINELPDQQKTVLILLKIEQKSMVEAAEIMNTTAKAVESLFQRAKKNLEKYLNETKDDE